MNVLGRPAIISSSIPESVKHLDLDVVEAALIRHGASVTHAAKELDVSASDLRKLCFAVPRLMDVAFEHEEKRIDLAEQRLDEALRSEDTRRHDSAAQFVLRNISRARRRGWTVPSAVDVSLNLNAEPQQFIVHWGRPDDDPETETIERDGKTFEVPKYGNGRGDDVVEGALAKPAAMIDHHPARSETTSEDVQRIKSCLMEEPVEHVEPTEPVEPPLPEWNGSTPPPPGVAHLYRPWSPPDPVEANRRRLERLRRWSSRGAA